VELLADEFIEFGSSGRVYTRDDLVAVLQTESTVVQTTSGFRMVTLAPDAALLTYKIRRHSDPCRGYPSILVVAEIERQVANGFPSGNREPGHVAMRVPASSGPRRAARESL
jgi:hypothetical protein